MLLMCVPVPTWLRVGPPDSCTEQCGSSSLCLHTYATASALRLHTDRSTMKELGFKCVLTHACLKAVSFFFFFFFKPVTSSQSAFEMREKESVWDVCVLDI